MSSSATRRRAAASSTNSFRYTGRENDGTGLAFFRARYYSPILQRFLSEDPIVLACGGFGALLNLMTGGQRKKTNAAFRSTPRRWASRDGT
jgi:RHS repeat-associated protein